LFSLSLSLSLFIKQQQLSFSDPPENYMLQVAATREYLEGVRTSKRKEKERSKERIYDCKMIDLTYIFFFLSLLLSFISVFIQWEVVTGNGAVLSLCLTPSIASQRSLENLHSTIVATKKRAIFELKGSLKDAAFAQGWRKERRREKEEKKERKKERKKEGRKRTGNSFFINIFQSL
jgi:hypothetical protein